MAIWLYRLGKASYRHAWRVLGVWLLALVAAVVTGFGFGGSTEESFRIPGSESQIAYDRLEAVFPAFAGASAQVVLHSPSETRLDSAQSTALIERLAREVGAVDGIEEAISPFDEFAGRALSDDGRYAYIQVQFEMPPPQVTDEMLQDLVATGDIAREAGLEVEFGGTVFQDQEVGLTVSEVFGVLFAGAVLVVTFRSFRPAWMPLASALIGVGIVLGIVFTMALVVSVSSSAPLLAVMLGLAVGIDYSLFILSRHRGQLAAGEDPEESAAVAVGTAGNAVVFAGVTVIIALLGLYVVGIPFLSVMGASAAIAVAVAIFAAITLLPALMGLSGEKLRPKPDSGAARIAALSADKPSAGRRWVRGVMRRPLLVTIVVALGLGTLAIPAASLDLNLPGGGQEPVDSTQRKAYELISEGFGPGYNGPLLVAVDLTRTNDILEVLEDLRGDLVEVEGVDYVSEGFPSPTLDTGIFQVIPTSAPDSPDTKVLVAQLREQLPELEQRYDAPMAVTGITAIGVDVSQRIQSALLPFGIVVVGLSIILLLAVFRSVVVPIKAALGFVLSVTAAFGVVVAIFQWGWFASLLHVDTPGPILSFMPIILMAVLFGLAMDYEVFLVAGMREQYVHTGDWRYAIEEGYSQGARVVTAAALIMFFVFFAFVPEGTNLIKPIALGLAVGIAFDAFVVRMTLVPALMALFKKAAWWLPSRLQTSLPHADVEGDQLRDHIRASEWARGRSDLALHADYLVLEGDDRSRPPLSLEIERGARVDAVAEAIDASRLVATIRGHLPPAQGSLQVAGHPLPSEAGVVREIVGAWSHNDEDALRPLGQSLELRLRLDRNGKRLTRAGRSALVRRTIDSLNTLSREVLPGAGVTALSESSIPGLCPRPQQLLIWAALGLADGASFTLLCPTEPVSDDEERALWWVAIERFSSPGDTVVLFSAPPARALSPVNGRSTIDLTGVEQGALR